MAACRRTDTGCRCGRRARRSLLCRRVLLLLGALLMLSGCALGGRGLREVRFTAPAGVDPQVRPLLAGVERVGVLCLTDIEPFPELDIEKVLARLGHAVARQLETRPGLQVVSQDEILWRLSSVALDSSQVLADTSRQALMDSLAVDAMVVVELQRLQARNTPMAPGPYGLTADPGLDLVVDMRMTLLNLHTGRLWQESGQEREWKPVRVQVGGTRQSEQQLLLALGRPLRSFLQRMAPPPSPQVREFDLRGR